MKSPLIRSLNRPGFYAVIVLLSILAIIGFGRKSIGKATRYFPLLKNGKATEDKIYIFFDAGDLLHIARLSKLVKEGNWEEYNKLNNWRRVKIRFKDKRYRAQIKSHGKAPTEHQYNDVARSFTVKLPKGKTIKSYRKFKLIVSRRLKYGFSTIYAAERNKVFVQKYIPVIVSISGRDEYDYVLSPPVNDVYTEKIGRGSMLLFTGDDSVIDEHVRRSFIYDEESFHWNPEDIDKLAKGLRAHLMMRDMPETLKEQIIQRHNKLNHDIINNVPENALEYFDLDYTVGFLFSRAISGEGGHLGLKGNQSVFYDTATAKFYPVVTHDASVNRVDDSFRSRPFPANMSGFLRENRRVPLYGYLLQNDEIRLGLMKRLYKYFSTDEYQHFFSPLSKEIRRFRLFDVDNMAEYLRKEIDRLDLSARMTHVNGETFIELRGRSLLPVKLSGIVSDECISSLNIHAAAARREGFTSLSETRVTVDKCTNKISLSEREKADLPDMYSVFDLMGNEGPEKDRFVMYEEPMRMLVRIKTPSGNHVPAIRELIVDRLGKKIAVKVIDAAAEEAEAIPALFQGLNEGKQDALRDFYGYGQVSGNQFVFPAGVHNVDKTLVFPLGTPVILKAGATINLANNAAIIVRGDLFVEGTGVDKVVIRPQPQESKAGVIAVIGSGREKVRIRGLKFIDGSEMFHNGKNLSGAMSIYNAEKVELSEIELIAPHSEDGINVKYARTCSLDRITVKDPYSDAIDIDACRTHAKNIHISQNNKAGEGGDGLDFSVSSAVVEDSVFNHMPDKGVSAGESSKIIVRNSLFNSNNIGIAVKDFSCVQLNGNRFNDNKIDVSVYRKKSNYGSGTVCIDDESLRVKKDKQGIVRFVNDSSNCIGDLGQ